MAACTTIGTHNAEECAGIDFGPREPLRFCVLVDRNVSEATARKLIGKVGKEFDRYNIDVQVVSVQPWTRPGFSRDDIIVDVARRPLEPPCDRLVAMVGRNLGDALWGLVMPEVLGAVEILTHSKGYVVAQSVSLNQAFRPPRVTTVHESYHFLGCHHGVTMSECYRRIQVTKAVAHRNRAQGRDFFPGVGLKGEPIETREQVNALTAVMHVKSSPLHPPAGKERIECVTD